MKSPCAGTSAPVFLVGLAAWMALPLCAGAARARSNVNVSAAASQPEPEEPLATPVDAAAPPVDAAAPAASEIAFPKLPAVSAMMGAASDTLKSVNSQASVLEARVAQAQLEDEAKLARQKAVFEQKLRVQEQKNQMEVRANEAISHEIESLKANNSALRKRAQELQEGNRLMRTELRALESRFGLAQAFSASALKSSVDTEAPELAVLRPAAAASTAASVHKAHHRHEVADVADQGTARNTAAEASQDDDQDDDADDKEDGTAKDDADDRDGDKEDDEGDGTGASLLSLAARVRRATASRAAVTASAADAEIPADAEASSPGDLLAVLSKGVSDLQKEEKESEAKLKAMFLTSFRAGTRKHATLLGQQKALKETRATLQALRNKLEAADQRLETTRSGLEQRLRGVGLFAQKLAHLALAPATEVQRLLQALPQEVAIAPTPAQSAASAFA